MALDPVKILNRCPAWVRRAVLAVTQGRGVGGAIYDRVAHRYDSKTAPALPARSESPVRVLIGPANEAEQGYQWARSFERYIPGVDAQAMMGFDPAGYGVRADLRVPTPVYLRSSEWHERFEAFLGQQTHVLRESGIPLLGRRYRSDPRAESEALQRAGVRLGALFHGSDLRLPSQHARESVWSPFRNDALPSALFEDKARANIDLVNVLGTQAFVSTPDLLRYLPQARWCPVVVDVDEWQVVRSDEPRPVPVVLHAPSNVLIKGSHLVEPMLGRLEAEGVIKYRRVTGVKYEQMHGEYARADIVLDQFLIGSYGVVACEAMAAGCVVVAHIDDASREVVRTETGLEIPIVQATVDNLEEVLRGLVADPVRQDELRKRATEYVREVHDGRRSANSTREFLTGSN